jgi:hypothetical protein
MSPPAVSSSKGVHMKIKSCRLILKQLSIIPTENRALSSVIHSQEYFSFSQKVWLMLFKKLLYKINSKKYVFLLIY